MQIPIIYEDEVLLVIDKPSGIVVNRAESVKGETLQDWVEAREHPRGVPQAQHHPWGGGIAEVGGLEANFYNRSGIVHRLDKETSGLLVIAKTPQVFLDLQTQFKDRKVSKKYITLVHGKVIPAEGEIRASVGRLPWNRERFGILPGGREAVTSYKVIDYYQNVHLSSRAKRGDLYKFLKIASPTARNDNNFSLLEVTPYTGRTHQIRIHLKYLGHPVVADSFYAGRKTAKADREFCPRLFLHAAYIAFFHPKSKNLITFTSELPADLQKVLKGMIKNV